MNERSPIGKAPVAEAVSVISIALIEDNRLVREGISALLNQLPDLKVVAGESSGESSLLKEVKPQVVLLD
ncbi:MAG: hypothetical protein ABSB58_10075, partial [Gemmatimonadales bacterium]